MRFRTLLIAATILFLPIVARAQDMQPACKDAQKPLPAELSGWAEKTALGAATRETDIAKAPLIIGHAAAVTLHHTPEISYVAQPAKPGGSVSYGGLVELDIKNAGTYRIGLSSSAWIDVIKSKAAIASTGHGHGPDCSTLHKTVDFPLEAGRYALQISANAEPTIDVMIWPQP